MRKVLFVSVCLASLAVSAIAQQQQGTVEMDAVAFVRDPGKIQVEIYYSILEGALRFEQKGTVWSAPINARAEIWQDGHAVAGRDIKKEVPFTGTTKMALDSAKTSLMLDGTALTGNFRSNDEAVLIFHVKDEMGRDVSDTIKRSFFAPTVLADKFYLGGVELARTLTPAVNHDSPFEKVGYVILPNPSKVFGQTNSKLNYYTELYIPASSVSASARCEVVTRVLDAQKHEMFSNSHSQTLAASTIPLIGSIDIDGLPTDSYILEIVVKRGATTEATMQKVFFFDSGMKLSEDQGDAASAAALDEETVYASSDISKMAQLEVEEKGDQAMYIGSGEQTKDWKKLKKKAELDGAQKESAITDERRFLYHFWRTKDKEQGSSVPLVAYKVYYAHVDEANKKFTYQKTAGWKSDFGRIYLTYGAPEERYITKQLHNTDAKPYITWEYYDKNMHLIAGSHAIFAFVDVQGGGKFVLVHSNVEGESYEPNWYSEEARRTN